MNPINLLTTGRTILGLKERPGRYKLLSGGVLPKFSKSKERIPTTPHNVQNPQPALFEPSRPAVVPLKEKETPVSVKEVAAIAVVTPKAKEHPFAAIPAVPTPRSAPRPGLWRELADWVQKWIPARKTPPSPLESFQTELALEKIKVMRNDLSEDDLEVVMIDRKAGKKAKLVQEKVDLEGIAANP